MSKDGPPPSPPRAPDGSLPAIAGASGLMLAGAGMILLAFFDPEPTSKLGLLVGGGLVAVLGGGAIFASIFMMRNDYTWTCEIDATTGKVVWTASPKKKKKKKS